MFRVKSTRRNGKRSSPEATVATVAADASVGKGTTTTVMTVPATTVVPSATATTTVPPVATVPPIAPVLASTVADETATPNDVTPAKDSFKKEPAAKLTPANTLEFFAAESAATALTKPWLRLERGLRLQRFRAYAEAYPGLSTSEKMRLYELLVIANDKKQLNTKQQVTYENGVIQSIRGLKVIRTGVVAEPAVIKIEPPQATKRNTKDV
jgi:hypothetical protein